ncbi:MAG: M20/M25/M40 family metallo-hydrolase [Gammaproteobacteria bacterium]|jgi:Zn-dependent M28 family amino/carboxypeptidase|nr:M20/M25/M40 family metallo-hydrolase [Gammaproteobacteria bacterium]MDH3863335.1 M20/M25/M40 family metallo-hydrolase [Gammaproteobacteria bacterium]MDH3905636.1 M20/M25/M40 family metallo-hydrolase [Gammaproteobacteria bacterium]NCF58227.1 M20/M25/M40 family metallo-hydrolase [Gammaproteobacteria bacterium]
MRLRAWTVLPIIGAFAACDGGDEAAREASPRIETERLSSIVRELASDQYEGRAPGTPGGRKTVEYLVRQFSELGLEPGGIDGGWTHDVPLIHTLFRGPANLRFVVDGEPQPLEQKLDIEASTVRAVDSIAIDAPVVFVGFGAYAPERDWDDYGDVDLEGKVALYLVNDPDFAAEPGEPVAGRFGGRRMTYYGRWAYKFEEAARRGAAAALVIHETEAAGYGWNVASSSPGENYAVASASAGKPPVMLQGWLHGEAAAALMGSAGYDLEELRIAARSPDFQAFELGSARFAADISVSVEHFESSNVLAILPGKEHPDELLMVAAHWDAYGVGEPDEQGRTVRPGANDDALGIAGVLEIARVLKSGPPLQRSVIFAAWTAEESGLLGSDAYARDPIYPLEKTAANLSLDILNTAGPARDVVLVGEGQSELEDDLARAAAAQGRSVTPESLPENGLFYRADHFPMARGGVPVLLIMQIAGAADLVEGGRQAGEQWIADYIGNCYHQTCDAWDPDWDLRGAAQDIELIRTIIEELGNSRRWPQWKAGSEFKAIREQSAGARTEE